jgi:hypothetical protein
MGDAARAPRPPPVTGDGEPERGMNEPSDDGAAWSLVLAGRCCNGLLLPEDCDDEDSLSLEPSVSVFG